MQDINVFVFQNSVRSLGPKIKDTATMTQMVSKPFK